MLLRGTITQAPMESNEIVFFPQVLELKLFLMCICGNFGILDEKSIFSYKTLVCAIVQMRNSSRSCVYQVHHNYFSSLKAYGETKNFKLPQQQ